MIAKLVEAITINSSSSRNSSRVVTGRGCREKIADPLAEVAVSMNPSSVVAVAEVAEATRLGAQQAADPIAAEVVTTDTVTLHRWMQMMESRETMVAASATPGAMVAAMAAETEGAEAVEEVEAGVGTMGMVMEVVDMEEEGIAVEGLYTIEETDLAEGMNLRSVVVLARATGALLVRIQLDGKQKVARGANGAKKTRLRRQRKLRKPLEISQKKVIRTSKMTEGAKKRRRRRRKRGIKLKKKRNPTLRKRRKRRRY